MRGGDTDLRGVLAAPAPRIASGLQLKSCRDLDFTPHHVVNERVLRTMSLVRAGQAQACPTKWVVSSLLDGQLLRIASAAGGRENASTVGMAIVDKTIS